MCWFSTTCDLLKGPPSWNSHESWCFDHSNLNFITVRSGHVGSLGASKHYLFGLFICHSSSFKQCFLLTTVGHQVASRLDLTWIIWDTTSQIKHLAGLCRSSTNSKRAVTVRTSTSLVVKQRPPMNLLVVFGNFTPTYSPLGPEHLHLESSFTIFPGRITPTPGTAHQPDPLSARIEVPLLLQVPGLALFTSW